MALRRVFKVKGELRSWSLAEVVIHDEFTQ